MKKQSSIYKQAENTGLSLNEINELIKVIDFHLSNSNKTKKEYNDDSLSSIAERLKMKATPKSESNSDFDTVLITTAKSKLQLILNLLD
jgi:adenylate cyclase class IV